MTDSNDVKKVLITGGAGYVGSVLAKKLLDKGYCVRVLDNLLYGNKSSMEGFIDNPNFEFIEGSIYDKSDAEKSILGVDAVVHLACIVGDPACSLKPDLANKTNYDGTIIMAEAAKSNGVKRFIFASSCSVYGTGKDILDENSPMNPVSLYARNKIDAENKLIEMTNDNFKPTIMRKSTVYGPSTRMRFDLVVNILTAKAVTENKINIFGGSQWRPLIHVEDVCEAYIKCIESPLEVSGGQTFNVGSSKQNYQIVQLGEMVKEQFPDIEMEVNEDDTDARDYRVSFTKIESKLGFSVSKDIPGAIVDIAKMIKEGKINPNEKKYSNFLSLKEE